MRRLPKFLITLSALVFAAGLGVAVAAPTEGALASGALTVSVVLLGLGLAMDRIGDRTPWF